MSGSSVFQGGVAATDARADGQNEKEDKPLLESCPSPPSHNTSPSHSSSRGRPAADQDVEAGPSGLCTAGASDVGPGESLAPVTSIGEDDDSIELDTESLNRGRPAADQDVEAGPSGLCTAGASDVGPGESLALVTSIGEDDDSIELDTESLNRYDLLMEAIQKHDVAAVEQRLKEGADPSHHGRFGRTPLHEAITTWVYSFKRVKGEPSEENLRADTIKIIQELLKKARNKSVLDSLDNEGDSPLSLAIKSGDIQIVKELVRAGANVTCVNDRRGTALHEAAQGNREMLMYFLPMETIENTIDDHGHGAIHYAASASSDALESVKLLLSKFGQRQLTWKSGMGWTAWHKMINTRNINVARYLLQSGDYFDRMGLNIVDNFRRSPVVLSIDSRDVEMTALLLRNGAALSVEGEEKTAIEQITAKIANPSEFLRQIFGDCIYEEKNKIIVDYNVLVDGENKSKSQINVIEELVKCGQSKLLKHPMIESLIYIKWCCTLPVFYTILGAYMMFLLSLNVFVVTTFNTIEGNGNGTLCGAATVDRAPCGGCKWHYWVSSAFLYISVGLLFIQEYMWARLQNYLPSLKSCKNIRHVLKKLSCKNIRHVLKKLSCKNIRHVLKSCKKLRLEPWVKLFGLLLALAVPPAVGCARAPPPAPWQRHVACAALLLAWLQAMLLLSRFPGWGYYVLMFERVALNILKIFVTSICLVVGFAICFMVQFQSKPPFDGPVSAFVKTLVMMASEFDYEGLFDEKHDAELKDSRTVVRLLFVVFVIFIAIVLMNFMTGVAVSDVNELAAIGDVRRLEKQLELLSTLEGLGSTVLGKWWKRLSDIRFHIRQITRDLEINDPHSTTYYTKKKWMVYPSKFKFDGYQQTFSMKMQNAILDIANQKQTVNKLDALYDAVVEIPDYTNRSNVCDCSRSSVKTLKDKITSIEATNNDVISDLKEVNDRIKSIEEVNIKIMTSIKELNEIIVAMAQRTLLYTEIENLSTRDKPQTNTDPQN